MNELLTIQNIFYAVFILGYLSTTISLHIKLGDVKIFVAKKISEMEVNLASNYIRRNEFDCFKKDNSDSHKEIWQETNKIREDVGVIKGKVSNLVDGKIVAYTNKKGNPFDIGKSKNRGY